MSYSTCESALITLLKTVSGFTGTGLSENVKSGDYRVLGRKDKAIICTQGADGPHQHNGVDVMRYLWMIDAEVHIKFNRDISTIASDIRTVMDNIYAMLQKYPTLNGASGVTLAFAQSADPPELAESGSGARRFWTRKLHIVVREEVTLTGGEYP